MIKNTTTTIMESEKYQISMEDNKLLLNGKEIELPNKLSKCQSISMINDDIFVNGYQLINGEWKHTLKAFWFHHFG